MTYVITQGRAIGIPDLFAVYTTLGTPGNSNLPSVPTEAQLGEIVTAYDVASNAAATGAGGYGEFILLAVPTSTSVTAGLYYSFTPSDYKIAALPTSAGTTTTSGIPIALAVNSVTSNASSVQYTWFQVGGRGTALKTRMRAAGARRANASMTCVIRAAWPKPCPEM